jgi:carbon monoxide dehydrogenase subunit G
MEMQGSRRIAAPREMVWAALNDPEVLKTAIPGCQQLTGSPADGFEAVVKQKVGPVSATFQGRVTLSDVVALTSYTISGEGKGGAAGFAKGGAAVALADDADGTLLTYDVKATVGGKLAQLGSRLIDGFAKKMADSFFENFQAAVEPPKEAEPEAAAEAEGEKKPGWFRRMIGKG